VDVVATTERPRERPAARLKIDPELIPDDKREVEQPAEAA